MLKQCNLRAKIGSNLALYCITRLTYLRLYRNDAFILESIPKMNKDQSLKESTSGCVAIKLEILIPLVAQGVCDLLAGERRKNLTA